MGCSSPQSQNLFTAPQHAQRSILAPSRKRICILSGGKISWHDAAAELGMIDNIADGEGLVHGVGAGGSGGHVHGALPILLHVLSGLLRFGGGRDTAAGDAAAVEGVEVGLKEFTASLRVSPGLYAANGRLSLRFLGSRRRVILMHASAGAAFHLDNFPADKGDDDMPGNVIAASATGFNTISGTRQTSHKNSFKTRYHEKE